MFDTTKTQACPIRTLTAYFSNNHVNITSQPLLFICQVVAFLAKILQALLFSQLYIYWHICKKVLGPQGNFIVLCTQFDQ